MRTAMRVYDAHMRRNRNEDMALTHDVDASKRATNLSINADLLARVEALRQQQREDWLRTNRAAIDAYNEEVDSRGVFSDGLRTF